MHPLGVRLGFSWSFTPGIHVFADHQNVVWSLASKYSVCCLLCLRWSDLTTQSVHHHLLPRGKHLTLLPASRLTIQSPCYRVNFLEHKRDPVTPVVEMSHISPSFPDLVIMPSTFWPKAWVPFALCRATYIPAVHHVINLFLDLSSKCPCTLPCPSLMHNLSSASKSCSILSLWP